MFFGDETVSEWIRKRLPENIESYGEHISVGIADEEGKLIAGVVYSNYSVGNIELSIASINPRWATKERIKAILGYPFFNEQLGCRRLTAVTARDNHHVRDFLKRLGFMHEGTLHDALERGDAVIYGMTKRYFLRSKWNG